VNAGEWLAARTPPPDSLAERIRALLDGVPHDPSEAPHEHLARAADQRLTKLLERGDSSRAIAADLLAIDALVTYACEAAADELDPQTLVEWAEAFAKRIAALGTDSVGVAFRSGSEAGVVLRSRSEKPRSAKQSGT